MKYNLKNRPQWKGTYRTKDIYKDFISPLLRWVNDFERELRENLCSDKDCPNMRCKIIKEILGE